MGHLRRPFNSKWGNGYFKVGVEAVIEKWVNVYFKLKHLFRKGKKFFQSWTVTSKWDNMLFQGAVVI